MADYVGRNLHSVENDLNMIVIDEGYVHIFNVIENHSHRVIVDDGDVVEGLYRIVESFHIIVEGFHIIIKAEGNRIWHEGVSFVSVKHLM